MESYVRRLERVGVSAHEAYRIVFDFLKVFGIEELEKYGQQELTAGSLEVIDKLAHAIKNLHKIIEAAEEEEYSMAGGSYAYARGGNQGGGNQGGGRSNRSYRGGMYAREGGSYAYARGRGRNARRDSMGRYARNEGEYSMADSEEMVQNLRELMEEAPDEMTKREFQKFIQKIEMM